MNDRLEPLLMELDIQHLDAYFQPIVQLHSARIAGYEALLRPATYDGTMLAPGILFERATTYGALPELEREARTVALKSFAASLRDVSPSSPPMLILNVSAPLLNVGDLDARHIQDAVRKYGIQPGSVAVEITESSVQETDQLLEFSRSARHSGFAVTLDGYGTDQSHLERIARIRPEIIKIDRSIVHGVHQDETKQYVLESMVHLAHRVGAVTLAFGLEEYEDVVECTRAGVELGQGFFLGRPAPTVARAEERGATHLAALRERLAASLATDLQRTVEAETELRRTIQDVVTTLSGERDGETQSVLEQWGRQSLPVDCVFVTDGEGQQITDIVPGSVGGDPHRAALIHMLHGGNDHRYREYVYGLRLRGHGDLHLSSPHLSPATGQLCRTYSCRFPGEGGTDRILCVSVPVAAIEGKT